MDATVTLAANTPRVPLERRKALKRLASEVDLPLAVGLWVLGAHALTLLSPLLLMWAATVHAEFLAQHMAHPALIYVGASVMMVGSALEIAQNTFDRWYLTADTGSALLPTLVACLFYTTICIGLLLVGVAVDDTPWLVALMVCATLGTPILYLLDVPHHGMSGLLGAIVTLVLYRSFGDPSVFLFIVVSGSTGYFFTLLLKTESQALHGFTAIVNGVGTAIVAFSMHRSALGAPASWTNVGIDVVLYAGLLAAAYPTLSKLKPTPRRTRSAI